MNKNILKNLFLKQSNINFAFLFGSRANGRLLKTNIDKIDIVDLQSASLSIMSSVVEDGIILKGDGLLELNLFYKRIWSLEEDFYWRLQYENRTLSS